MRAIHLYIVIFFFGFVAGVGFAEYKSSTPKYPPIVGSADMYINADGEKIFQQRVEEKFPIGSSELALIYELSAEGFNISKNYANFKILGSMHGICRHDWSIRWKADEKGQITEITGNVYGSCP